MAFDEATVARISRLARIATTDEERRRLAGELGAILTWVEQLDEVDVGDVAPMTSVTDMVPISRDDRVSDGGAAEEVLRNAPEREDGFFVVPKVVE